MGSFIKIPCVADDRDAVCSIFVLSFGVVGDTLDETHHQTI